MKMPFEWVVGDSSKGLHGDRAHVYDGGGAVTVNYTTLRGTTPAVRPHAPCARAFKPSSMRPFDSIFQGLGRDVPFSKGAS